MRARQGAPRPRTNALDRINRGKPSSRQLRPRRLIGKRSRRSRRKFVSPLLWVKPVNPGPYTIRVKVPHGVKPMPHRHPEDRVYTVISGVFYIGLGDQFDSQKLQAYAPGSVIVLPGGTSHFHWARSGEYITQVTAIGPLGLEYVDSADDPRTNRTNLSA
jgi:quercetin dioxygenase-like cupin family protein